jgi:hypothetical protein
MDRRVSTHRLCPEDLNMRRLPARRLARLLPLAMRLVAASALMGVAACRDVYMSDAQPPHEDVGYATSSDDSYWGGPGFRVGLPKRFRKGLRYDVAERSKHAPAFIGAFASDHFALGCVGDGGGPETWGTAHHKPVRALLKLTLEGTHGGARKGDVDSASDDGEASGTTIYGDEDPAQAKAASDDDAKRSERLGLAPAPTPPPSGAGQKSGTKDDEATGAVTVTSETPSSHEPDPGPGDDFGFGVENGQGWEDSDGDGGSAWTVVFPFVCSGEAVVHVQGLDDLDVYRLSAELASPDDGVVYAGASGLFESTSQSIVLVMYPAGASSSSSATSGGVDVDVQFAKDGAAAPEPETTGATVDDDAPAPPTPAPAPKPSAAPTPPPAPVR